MKHARTLILLSTLGIMACAGWAIEIRFAPPDFITEYQLPGYTGTEPTFWTEFSDVSVLFGALCMATWLVHKGRSRRGLFLLSVASVAYFGFWRKGCICPVGSLQNVAAAVFLKDVGVPVSVVLIFMLPLLFSLFFGRVFCAAVCPLGAIQEVVAVKPIRISQAWDQTLGMFKYVYLGIALLGVGTAAGFWVCRFDPFVGLFRLGHSFNMMMAGAVILTLGVFVARPYCRFLCPYGVLLGWMSKFSKWHLDIAPKANCVECRLCETSCPYNAMDMPTPMHLLGEREQGIKRTRQAVILVPLIVIIGAAFGYMMKEPLSRLHPTVALSEEIAAEDLGLITGEPSLETESFRKGNVTVTQLHADAMAAREKIKIGGIWLGAFLGLMLGFRLVGVTIVKKRTIFEANKEHCYSCGRCYPYCPVEPEGATH